MEGWRDGGKEGRREGKIIGLNSLERETNGGRKRKGKDECE